MSMSYDQRVRRDHVNQDPRRPSCYSDHPYDVSLSHDSFGDYDGLHNVIWYVTNYWQIP